MPRERNKGFYFFWSKRNKGFKFSNFFGFFFGQENFFGLNFGTLIHVTGNLVEAHWPNSHAIFC